MSPSPRHKRMCVFGKGLGALLSSSLLLLVEVHSILEKKTSQTLGGRSATFRVHGSVVFSFFF